MLFSSCSNQNTEKNLINEETFVQFTAEYFITQENNTLNSIDSLTGVKRLDSVYLKFNLTKEQIEATRQQYNNDLKKWQVVYEKVITEIESRQKETTQPQKLQ